MTFFLDQTFPTLLYYLVNIKKNYANKFPEITKFVKTINIKFSLLRVILNYILN